MDIYQRYSEEDIEYVENLVSTTHISEIANLMIEARNSKDYWERYYRDRKKEKEGKALFTDDPEDDIMSGFLKAICGTEKLSEEEERKGQERYGYVKKIYDIITNDSDIQEELGKRIEDVYYNEEDTESRINVLVDLMAALQAFKYKADSDEFPLQEYRENYEIIFNSISNVIQELNFADFTILYSSVGTRNFFENPNFTDTIVSKIDEMSIEELMHFCLSTQDGLDARNEKIVNAKKTRAEQFNAPALTELLNTLHVETDTNCPVMDKIASLYRGEIENKEQVYSELTDSEFVLFLLKHKNASTDLDQDLLASEETSKRLDQLSRENLLILTEAFYKHYMQYYTTACKLGPENVNSIFLRKKQWEFIMKKAQERGILSEDFEQEYAKNEREYRKIKDKMEIYRDINSYKYFPRAYTYFKANISPKDSDIDELGIVATWRNRFEKCNQSLQSVLNVYQNVNELAQKSDIQILQEANRYNVKLAKLSQKLDNERSSQSDTPKTPEDVTVKTYNFNELKQKIDRGANPIEMSEFRKRIEDPECYSKKEPTAIEKKLPDEQKFCLNYIKKRILGMPESFATFFMPIEGGIFTDVMQIKIDDLQYKLKITKGDTEIQK